MIYRWIRQQKADAEYAFPGKGNLKPDEAYVRKLERELKQAQEDRDILKKALAYFSKNER
jgi:transposase